MTDETKSPTNTAGNPLENLLTAMSPNGIENQEARGQRELLESEVLPTDINNDDPEVFEALGFVFEGVLPNDPLFQRVRLPEGWSRKGSEHSMWSYVVDERGIERVGVFYKAAFYDRRARMSLVNVGHRIVTEWIYGDNAQLTLHPELTSGERADIRATAQSYREKAEEHPDIYKDRVERIEKIFNALDSLND